MPNKLSKAEKSIHVLGNGQLCVFQQGAEIREIFGKPYSTPNFAAISTDIAAETKRIPNSAIYQHTLANGAVFTDIVDAARPCFVRKIETNAPFSMDLQVQNGFTCIREGELFVFRGKPGQIVFHEHVTERHQVYAVFGTGNIKISPGKITVEKGESCLFVAGCQEYDELLPLAEAMRQSSFAKLRQDAETFWQDFAFRRQSIPQECQNMADTVAVLIKAQQGSQGGVIAGHKYHMAYVRDQYGTARGLLAMGHTAEAKQIMQFYHRIWQKEGKLHNAHGIGVDSIFHIHENDEAEITGYLVVQAFDLYHATKDAEFLNRLLPMLRWAMEKQISRLENNMLPFNGDETYIAGGLLGRHAIEHGSAEATLLFIQGGELYCAYTGDQDGFLRHVRQAKAAFAENFIRDGFLIANNPHRIPPEQYPRFRFGVCESCGDMYWLEKSETGRYLCPPCIGVFLPPGDRKEEVLPAAALSMFFMEADFIAAEQIWPMVEQMIQCFEKTGTFTDNRKITGYELGFFLFMLVKLGHPLQHAVFQKLLAIADENGGWMEYYTNEGLPMPGCCHCRPWESGINIAACIAYAKGLEA